MAEEDEAKKIRHWLVSPTFFSPEVRDVFDSPLEDIGELRKLVCENRINVARALAEGLLVARELAIPHLKSIESALHVHIPQSNRIADLQFQLEDRTNLVPALWSLLNALFSSVNLQTENKEKATEKVTEKATEKHKEKSKEKSKEKHKETPEKEVKVEKKREETVPPREIATLRSETAGYNLSIVTRFLKTLVNKQIGVLEGREGYEEVDTQMYRTREQYKRIVLKPKYQSGDHWLLYVILPGVSEVQIWDPLNSLTGQENPIEDAALESLLPRASFVTRHVPQVERPKDSGPAICMLATFVAQHLAILLRVDFDARRQLYRLIQEWQKHNELTTPTAIRRFVRHTLLA